MLESRHRVLRSATLAGLLVMTASSMVCAEKKVTIKLWHVFGGTKFPIMNKIIADFEKKYPNIKVEPTYFDQWQRHSKILPAIAAGKPPDVMILGRVDIPSYVTRGVLKSLDAFMESDKVSANLFYKPEIQLCQYKGQTWILPCPVGGASFLLFNNRQKFKQAGIDPSRPPETWAELESYSRKLTIKNADGSLRQIGFIPDPSYLSFKGFLYNNGGEWLSSNARKIMLNNPRTIDTLEWMMNYRTKIYGNAAFAKNTSFPAETMAMTISGTWDIFPFKTANPKLDFGLGEMPSNIGSKGRGVISEGWGYVMPKNTKYPKEAWKLINYLCVGEGAETFYKGLTRPSPLKKLNQDPFFKEKVPGWQTIMDAMEKDLALPVSPVNPELDNILATMLTSVFSRKKSPESAVKEAVQQSQKLLNDAWKRLDAMK